MDRMERERTFELRAIGTIRSPFRAAAGTPIQPTYAQQAAGRVILDPAFEDALADIDGFERIWLIYSFDRAGAFKPQVVPYRDDRPHGVFATRAPNRPNPIGLSVVRLLGREGRELRVDGVDVLDGTPLLDLKPYVPEFDAFTESRAGWLDDRRADRRLADGRFHDPD